MLPLDEGERVLFRSLSLSSFFALLIFWGSFFRLISSGIGIMEVIDHLADERNKAEFDVEEMKIVWAGSQGFRSNRPPRPLRSEACVSSGGVSCTTAVELENNDLVRRRFTSVTIKDSPSIMLKGMEGSTLGVWAALGEGRAYFPDEGVLDHMLHSDLALLRYCDDDGSVTEAYPFNLNGSPLGIAVICSPDGRHLAMMPHPDHHLEFFSSLFGPLIPWMTWTPSISNWVSLFLSLVFRQLAVSFF